MNEDFTDAFWFSLDNARKGGKIFKKAEAVRDIPGFYDLMLNTTKWLAKETLAGAASGQILTAKKLYTDLYRDVLSAYTQKQSENLVTMPLGVSRQLRPRITGTAYRKFGHYKMTGKHSFSASGEWHRDGSVLNMHAKWKLNNTYLHTGARFSGNFENGLTEVQAELLLLRDQYPIRGIGKHSTGQKLISVLMNITERVFIIILLR